MLLNSWLNALRHHRLRKLRRSSRRKAQHLQSGSGQSVSRSVQSLEERTLLTITTTFNAGTGQLTFTGNGDDDSLPVQSTGVAGEVEYDDGTGLGSTTQAGVNSIVFNGGGGDDRLILIMDSGNIFEPDTGTAFPITVNGQGGTGDSLVVAGGGAGFTTTYTPTGTNSGNLGYASGANTVTVGFSNLERLDEALDADSMTTSINGSADTINVVDGPVLAPVTAFVQGPILVDGGDRDDHGSFTGGVNVDGWQFIEQSVQFVHDSKEAEFGAAANDILSVGTRNPGSRGYDAIESAATVLGLNVTHVTGATIDTVDFTQYDLIYVPSNSDNVGGGILGTDLDRLVNRRPDIQAFVRAGGGIVALTDADTNDAGGNPTRPPYGWLEIPDPFTITDFGSGGIGNPNDPLTLRKTQAAIDAGLTITDAELSAGIPYHNDFTGPLPGFNGLDPFVLDRGPDGVADGPFFSGVAGDDDRVIVLGQGAINQTVGDGQSLEINDGGTNSFLTVNVANKVAVVVNSGGGNDTVTVNHTTAAKAAELTALTVNGEGGNDGITVRAVPDAVAATINGGDNNDTITVENTTSSLDDIEGTVSIDAGAGTDSVTIDDSGSATGETVSFTTTVIEGLTGVTGNDFTLVGNEETLTVSTSGGTDTLNVNFGGDTATDLASITINASGGTDGVNIQSDTPSDATTNLNGNAGTDTFTYAAGAFVVTGSIDGGSQEDTLVYSNYTTARQIQLDAFGSVDGFQGRDVSAASSLTAGFDNIDEILGSGNSDTLIGPNLNNHWDIGLRTAAGAAADEGVLVADRATADPNVGNATTAGRPTGTVPITPGAGERDLLWTSFENLTGGSQADHFDLRDQSSITGTVAGGLGSDSVDYRDWPTTVINVDLNLNTAPFIGALAAGGVGDVDSSIENAFGGDENDTIYGDDDNNVLGDGGGADELIGDRAREGVDPTGVTSGNDTFRLEPEDGVTDVVYDIAGNDTVDFRFASAGVVYDADLTGIQDVFNAGNAANVDLRLHDTLVGAVIPQPVTGNTPYENVIGSQFNDVIDIDPLSISGNFPTDIPVIRNVDGNDPPDDGNPPDPGSANPPADTLKFDGKGEDVIDTGLSITSEGVGTVTYQSVETLIAFDQDSRIIDNEDDAFRITPSRTTSETFETGWNDVTSGGANGSYIFSLSQLFDLGNVHSAIWSFDGLSAGLYRFSATWPDGLDDLHNATDAPFSVFDGGNLLSTVSLDQRHGPDDFTDDGIIWEDIGVFNIQTHSAEVILTNEVNGSVFADAIRVERVSAGPELSIVELATDEVVLDAVSSVDFDTTIGNALTRTFVITNQGTTDLSLTSAVELIQTSTNYTLTQPAQTTIAAGESTSFTVTLNADTANGHGDFDAEIRLFSNDQDENVLQLPGQGVNPTPDPDPLNDVNPFTFAIDGVVSNTSIVDDGDTGFTLFGSWDAGTEGYLDDNFSTRAASEGDRAVWRFDNLPDGRYRVSTTWEEKPGLGASPTSTFTVSDVNGVILAGGTQSVDQSIAPDDFNDGGAFWEDLGGPYTVTGGSIVVELLDTGNPDELVIADAVRIERLFDQVQDVTVTASIDGGASVAITDDSGVLDFGTLFPGSQRIAEFTVTNDGTADLTISEPVSLSGQFVLLEFDGQAPNGTISRVLTPTQSTTFRVQLNASTAGIINDSISFVTDDPDEAPFNATLRATVSDSVIIDNLDAVGFSQSGYVLHVVPDGYRDGVHFDAVPNSGSSATWTFTVDPNASYRIGATWTAHTDRATDAPFTVTGVNGGPTTVDLNQQLEPDDRLANSSQFEDIGVFTASGSTITVSLGDNANGVVLADAVRIESLFGPEIDVEEGGNNIEDDSGSVDFGTTTGANVTRTFTLINRGERASALGTLQLPAGFVQVGTFPSSIAAGATTTFQVALDGSNAGTFSGQLSFATDDLDETPFNFDISGTVIGTGTIIDNSDGGPAFTAPGFFNFGGSGHNGSFVASLGNGANTATWSFTGLTPGPYNVATTWTPHANRATNAPYRVTDSVGFTPFTVNQQAAPNDFTDPANGTTWETLDGVFIVDATGTLTVTLNDNANGYVDADAVRIQALANRPEIQVVEQSMMVNISDGASFTFPTTVPGTPVTRTFEVRNPGSGPLTLGTLFLPSGFTSTYTEQTIAAGGNATFDITFAADEGDKTGAFSFLTNDQDESPFNFNVIGRVAAPITVIDNGDGDFAQTGFTAFGNQGFQGDVHALVATNAGNNSTWTFNGVTPGATYRVSATWTAFSNRATDAPFTIAGGVGGTVTRDVNQRQSPSDFFYQGFGWKDLEIVRAAGSTLTVTLGDDANGTVVADAIRIEQVVNAAPEISVQEAGTLLVDGESTVDFGTVGLGSTATKTITVTNTGTATLNLVGTISVPAGFTLIGSLPTTLAAGASASFDLQLVTTAEAVLSGNVSFDSDDDDESPFDFTVTATVQGPTATLIDNGDGDFASSGFTAFGGQGFQNDVHFTAGDNSGDTASWTFNGLTNGDKYVVSISWSAFSNRATDAPFTVSGITGGPITFDINQRVAPDDRLVQGVGFDDLGIFEVSGTTLTVSLSDDGNGDVIADAVQILPVAGPEITVLDGTTNIAEGTTTVDFGTVAQNAVVTKTFTVRNDGVADLVLQPVFVPTGYSIVGANFTAGQIVAAGGMATIDIQIDSATTGTKSGAIQFGNNDTDEGPFTFFVTGEVVSNVLQVIDNGDTGFATSGFNPFGGQGFQGDVHFTGGDNSGDTATWTFSGLTAGGKYLVSASWSPFFNRATDAPYTISGVSGGPTTLDIDQRVAPDDRLEQGFSFEDLGIFTTTGTTLTVTLSDDGNGDVIADAIRVEQITGPEIEVLDGATLLTDGSGTVDFGTVLTGGTSTKTFTVRNIGATDLTVQPVTVPAGFTIVSNLGAGQIIPPDMSATFEIGVDTTAPGTFTGGSIQFTSDDADESPFDIAVQAVVSSTLILDDGDPTFSETAGYTTFAFQGYQSDVREALGDSSGDTATWTFQSLPAGTYRVSATWTSYFNRATDAPYSINGGAAIDINQQLSPNNAAFTSVQDATTGVFFADLNAAFAHGGGDLTVTLSDDADQNVIADAIRIERLGPLQVAGGEASDEGDAVRLTDADAALAFDQALVIWATAGLTPTEIGLLQGVSVTVTDLADGHLGAAGNDAIYLDINGAGYGWFVDQTPSDDSELAGEAAGRVDLLTVVLHELGHVLGLTDLNPAAHPDSLMNAQLATGTRRLPTGGTALALEPAKTGEVSYGPTVDLSLAFPADSLSDYVLQHPEDGAAEALEPSMPDSTLSSRGEADDEVDVLFELINLPSGESVLDIF